MQCHRRRRVHWGVARTVWLVALLLLPSLFAGMVRAGPPVVYMGATPDGEPLPFSPAPLPASRELDLWIETGPLATSAPQEICLDGLGDELCGWQLEIATTGSLTILDFQDEITDPDNPLETFRASDDLLRINRINAAPPSAGDFGRTRIGTITLSSVGTGDLLLTANSEAIDADLERHLLGVHIVASPEPDAMAGLAASLLSLAAWCRRRARVTSQAGSARTLLPLMILALAPRAADAQLFQSFELCVAGGDVRSYRPDPPLLPIITTSVAFPCAQLDPNLPVIPLGSSGSVSSSLPIGSMTVQATFRDLTLPAGTTATLTLSDGLGSSSSVMIPNNSTRTVVLVSAAGNPQVSITANHPVMIGSISVGAKPHCGDAVFDMSDPDGDGLPTAWEVCGLKNFDPPPLGQGMPIRVCSYEPCTLDLAAMGADPMRKDLFLEVDWMRRGPHSRGHWPRKWAVRKLVDAFREAPVSNPDGSTGISLHVDAGPWSEMNPVTGERWGANSQSNSIAHIDRLGSCEEIGGPNGCAANDFLTIWGAFDILKLGNLNNARNFAKVRGPVFRYGVLAHHVDGNASGAGPPRTLGIARNIESPDFILSLGYLNPSGGAKPLEQGATMMHEFGHALGLRHGGQDDTNLKPNYVSVMNYAFSRVGVLRNDGGNALQYSGLGALPDLDEFALDESEGIAGLVPGNPTALASFGTRWACPAGLCSATTTQRCTFDSDCPSAEFCGTGVCSASLTVCDDDVDCPGIEFCAFAVCSSSGTPCASAATCPAGESCNDLVPPIGRNPNAAGVLDWNCNGSTDVSLVAVDVNASSTGDVLAGNWNDWTSLVYTADHVGSLIEIPSSTLGSANQDLPYEILRLIRRERDVQIEADGDLGLRPGASTQLSFSIQNTGEVPDTYSLALVSDQGFASATLPASVTLDVDEEVAIAIDVDVPLATPIGVVEEVTLEATSQSDPLVTGLDGTIVDVFSCGDVNLDSIVDDADVRDLRAALLRPLSTPLGFEGEQRCSVVGGPDDCDLLDLVLLQRAVNAPVAAPGIAQVCRAATL